MQASAHELSIYAVPDGSVIRGRAYYGSAPAAGVRISVRDEQGQSLGHVTTNAQGEYAFTPTIRRDHVFIAETDDGHRAEDTVHWESLPESTPIGADNPGPGPPGALQATRPHLGEHGAHSASSSDPAMLGGVVEEAVRAQVMPLREELKNYRGEVRLYGVSAGVGFILGIFGVAALITARRRPSDRV
jgi:nickel transport protein